MKYTTFISEVQNGGIVVIPPEIRKKLDLKPGDKLEVTVIKIKARRLEILISENPLYNLVKFVDE